MAKDPILANPKDPGLAPLETEALADTGAKRGEEVPRASLAAPRTSR